MSWLSDLSIRYKIFSIIFIAVAGLAANLIFNYAATRSNALRLHNVQAVYFPTLERIDANLVRLDKIKETLNGAASAGEVEMIEDADVLAAAMRQGFAKIEALDSEVSGGVVLLQKQFDDYYAAAKPLTQGMIEGTLAAQQIQPTVAKMTAALGKFSSSLKHFRKASYQRFTDTINDANASSEWALTMGLIIAMICVGLVSTSGLVIGNVLQKNISRVVQNLIEIAHGEADLTTRLEQQGKDEIGQLVGAFNVFIEKLQNIIRNVSGSTSQLATAAEEMAQISEESNSSVIRQASETEQVASAMNEMSSTVAEVALHAKEAAESAQNASSASTKGRQVVEQTITAIGSLANEVEQAATVIQKLEHDSENIGGVLEVIRGISEQTNLLALNAAIEAARAGEQGRGFAVVADEVRTPASRTQESTKEIQAMIESLQSGSAQAVAVMEESRSKAQASVEQARLAGESLREITEAIGTISDMNTQIANASVEQGSVVEEINRNVSSISEIGEQTSQGAQQTATASQEMSQLATRLQVEVGQFKV
ncbi:MAG: methyl-accepting chemotaxis protein [Gammaproteobacteria bacterium]|nr:methyl-accepting chemotaxis protein [Gammaproteobacteria bacterium]